MRGLDVFKQTYQIATGLAPSDLIIERFHFCIGRNLALTKEVMIEEARKYPNLTAWQFSSWKTFCYACNANLIKECTSHMETPGLFDLPANVSAFNSRSVSTTHPTNSKRKAS